MANPNESQVFVFEQNPVHDALSGAAGTNRASVRSMLNADDDVSAVKAWLSRYADKATTYESYRKEAERLIMWSHQERKKPVSSLEHEDLQAYQQFLRNPTPKARWVMIGKKVSRTDPGWKPFTGALSASSQRQAMLILNGMFNWLYRAGYLASNPWVFLKVPKAKQEGRLIRFLEDDLWVEVKLAIETMPKEAHREREHYSRARWLITLLYLTGMRISEVTTCTMGNFYNRKSECGDQQWWLEITGKGDKTRVIPVSDELIVEIARYRRELGLYQTPQEGDPTPLLLPIGGKQRHLTRSSVHEIIKMVFKRAASRLEDKGGEAVAKIARLNKASTHWLRHTAGSEMASNMDIRFVRDNLGHTSLTTTNVYLHSDNNQRHKITVEKHKIKW